MQLGGGSVRPDVIRVGGIELDDKEKRVMLDGELVALTPTEYEILKLLIQNPVKLRIDIGKRLTRIRIGRNKGHFRLRMID